MAKKRKFCAYRRLERPYTRVSKYRRHNYIKARPSVHIVKYTMGDKTTDFPFKLTLHSKSDLQIRHLAMESARQTSIKYLEANLGKKGFLFKINKFPHHILRENPLASGAGADRMSTGMKCSFGKPIGSAAQYRKGDTILTVGVTKENLEVAKHALKRASYKLPCSCNVVVEEVHA